MHDERDRQGLRRPAAQATKSKGSADACVKIRRDITCRAGRNRLDEQHVYDGQGFAFGASIWRSHERGGSRACRRWRPGTSWLIWLGTMRRARESTSKSVRWAGSKRPNWCGPASATDVVVLASKVMAEPGGRRPYRQRRRKGLRPIGDRARGPARARRDRASTANRPSGRRCSRREDFATRPVRAAITSRRCARNGAWPNSSWRARSWRRRACRWRRWSRSGDADLGISATERTDRPTRRRGRRSSAAGNSGRNRVLGRRASTSAEPEAAHALVAYLASAEPRGAKRRYGMEPA